MLQVKFARGNQMSFMTKDIPNEKWKGQDCVREFWKKRVKKLECYTKDKGITVDLV